MSNNLGIFTRSMAKKRNKPSTSSSEYDPEKDISDDDMDYSDSESVDEFGNVKNLISYSDEDLDEDELEFYNETDEEVSETEDDEDLEYREFKKRLRSSSNNSNSEVINITVDGDDEERIKEIISSYILQEFDDNTEAIEIPKKKKNVVTSWDNNDCKYFNKLTPEEKDNIMEIETNIKSINTSVTPLRFQVLESGIDLNIKAIAIRKIETLKNLDPSGTEYYKIKNWIDGLLMVPFGKYSKLPIGPSSSREDISNYLKKSQNYLNNAIYGHFNAKCHILQIISQWIINPNSVGNAIAIHGPMGIGKTTLVKEGISKALNKPCAFISLGGSTDSSYLDGHSYTYEGSQPGRIIEILKKAKCMDPVIYFDELDKVSDTAKGEEIINLLVHLTDTSQNSHFQDKYYSGIDLDLSKCLFIFSYNDPSKVNPILADRMYKIKLDSFKLEDKKKILMDYMFPNICKNFSINVDDIILNDETLNYLISNYSKEEGVRSLKRAMETIISKLNIYIITGNNHNLDLPYKLDDVKLPFELTPSIIEKLLTKENDNSPPIMMYS